MGDIMKKSIVILKIIVNLVNQCIRFLLFIVFFMWQGDTFGTSNYEKWGEGLDEKLKMYLNDLK